MKLTLTVLRCPDRVAPEVRQVDEGSFVLGRAADADWVLEEPSNMPQLSRRHCTLSHDRGAWTLTDTSTNGTMLNGERMPRGTPTRELREGDRLRLGSYEIEIGFAQAAGATSFGGDVLDQGGFGDGPFERAGRPAESYGARSGPFELPRSARDPMEPSIRLPDQFLQDPFAPSLSHAPAAQPDHTPAHDDVIRPPSARMILPAEWDRGPDDVVASRDPAPLPRPEPPAPAPPAAPPVSDRVHPAAASDSALIAAFLDGAGMPPQARPDDPVQAMREAGAAFRAFVHGLRRALIARAEVKNAFRIDQTMVRSRRNNPLKFAAGDDDALAALLGRGRHADMTGAEAVEGALTDIRLHELATIAAMRDAVHDVLGKLDPAAFLAAAENSMLPAKRRARAFDLFEVEFRKLQETLSEKFDDAFGRSFAAAYERVIRDMRGREPPA